MYWILAAICLLMALAVPKLRRAGIVGCVILAALLAWAMMQRLQDPQSVALQERGRPTTPAVPSQPLPVEALELKARLSGGGAPFKLAGTIINRSTNMILQSLALEITRRDCYAGALDPSGCIVLWRNRHWLQVTVPPQQQREFGVSIWARGDAPQATGTTQDEFTIVAANGAPAQEN
jgi:hypothetical protein